MESTLEAFGAWLQEQRERRGWTRLQVAQQVGVCHATVGRWERGRMKPGVSCCISLADLFDLPSSEVLKLAGHISTTVQPAAIRLKRMQTCENCPVVSFCRRDVLDRLPAWCETVNDEDVFVAEAEGRLPQLKARYEKICYGLDRQVLQQRHPQAVPSGAG